MALPLGEAAGWPVLCGMPHGMSLEALPVTSSEEDLEGIVDPTRPPVNSRFRCLRESQYHGSLRHRCAWDRKRFQPTFRQRYDRPTAENGLAYARGPSATRHV